MSKRDNLIGLRLNDEEKAALEAAAVETDGSIQAVIRGLLRRAFGLKTVCGYPVQH